MQAQVAAAFAVELLLVAAASAAAPAASAAAVVVAVDAALMPVLLVVALSLESAAGSALSAALLTYGIVVHEETHCSSSCMFATLTQMPKIGPRRLPWEFLVCL